MFSKDGNSKHRQHGFTLGCLLLAGVIATTSFGADTPAASTAAPIANTAPQCGRHGEMDLGKMNEHAAKMFASADSNGDGKITEAEFLAFKPMHGGAPGHPGMGGMGMGHGPGGTPPTPQERDAQMQAFQTEVFKALDTDHNGQLSAAEFSSAHEAVHNIMAKHMFTKLDRNGDGVLTKDEFPFFMQKLSAMDTNADGTVSHDEMKAAHAAKGAQPDPTPH